MNQFLLPNMTDVATNRRDTEFVLSPQSPAAAKPNWIHRLLPAWLAIGAGLAVWVGWGLHRSWQLGSNRLHPALLVLPALGFALLAVGAIMLSRSRKVAAENQQLIEANNRLLQERDLLRTIIDNLPDCIYAKNREGRFLVNNPAHAADMGVPSARELKDKSDFDFFPRELAQQFFDDEQAIMTTGQSVINQEQYKLSPGKQIPEKRWSLTSKVIWRGPDGQILGTVGITRDIHDFKRTQEALRRSEQRLREVLRRTRCILNFGEVEGLENWREHALDEQSAFRWSFPVQNVEGAQEVCPLDVPPDSSYQQVWSGSRHTEDFKRMNRNSGNAFLNDLPFYRNEFRCMDKLGTEHWMQEFVTIEKLTDNRWQVFGITTEITELKHGEEALRASEEKLRRFAAQLELSNRELQDFAYVASHDLQEPLRKIVVFGERLKEKCAENLAAEPRDYVERMQKAAARMQTLINDLLTFSRLTTKVQPFAPLVLTDIAHGVLEDLESRLEQVHGRVELGELPVIDADPLQMRQLFQNLIGNALKFHHRDVPPVVKVSARQYINDTGFAMCELSVSDNGIGFDEKYLDRIFNVFQRLHSRTEYEGTGMGLAIVRKIALHHGGSVTARSRTGEGANFLVTLPVKHTTDEALPANKP
jgi:PAS domain S-box-containing protein